MQIQIYKNCKSPEVEYSLSSKNILLGIKNGIFSKESIIKAREIGKGNNGYDFIKTNKINTCTWNFKYDKYKENKNIVSPTGLLFIDIDDKDFDIEILDKSKIYAYYKSIGGNGYGILVKVNGLTLNNFSDTYIDIVNKLGISNKFDKGAKKATQFNVLSFDKDMFYNENSITFNSVNNIKKDINKIDNLKLNQKRDISPYLEREERNMYICPFFKLKHKIELEEYDEDCVYIKEGKLYYEVYFPFDENGNIRKVLDGEKHTILSSIANNIICINPNATQNQIYNYMIKTSNNICLSKVDEKDIKKIVDYKFKQLQENKLKPIGARLKYFWVNPNCKNKYKAFNDKRIKLGFNALDAFFGDEIYNQSNKVTYALIAKIIGVSEKTIKRKITEEQKQIIKEFNKQLKNK